MNDLGVAVCTLTGGLLFIFAILLIFTNNRLNLENKEIIEASEAKCVLGVMGSNGIGFETHALLSCENLKINCESPNHDIPCIWEEFDNKRGCRCDYWG